MNNKLYVGDNLSIMKNLQSESIDLVATDIPFMSQRDYGEFDDRWSSLKEFIKFMKLRLIQIHRLLKPTGSIYVHCDPTNSHYLKIEIDKIFHIENFRNEIIWHYNKWSNSSKWFQKNHDSILYYSKTENYTFNNLYGEMTKDMKQMRDRGYNTGTYAGGRMLMVYDANNPKAKLKIESGKYKRIYYIENQKNGVPLSSCWNDIKRLGSNSGEQTGYPTQKPMALYQRIIKASSNEGDLVLDPFVGSGTTLDAAQSLNRRWIGIDKNANAVDYIKKRFDKYGLLQPDYEVIYANQSI